MPVVRRLAVLAASALVSGLVVVPVVAAPAVAAPAAAGPVAAAAPATETVAIPTVEKKSAPVTMVPQVEAPKLEAPTATAPILAMPRPSTALPVAPAFSDDGSCAAQLPVGAHVTRSGPAGLSFEGAASCKNGVWTLKVDGGSGRIAGLVLTDDDFGGTVVQQRTGVRTGKVTVDLPDLPQVVADWSQRARVKIVPKGSGWTGTVTVAASSGASAHLALTGELRSNGAFRLSGSGAVAFAGTEVPLSGTYRSTGYPVPVSAGQQGQLTSPRWSVSGTGPTGDVPGARVLHPSLAATQSSPGLAGAAGLQITRAPYRNSAGSLSVVNTRNWAVTVERPVTSGKSRWVPPHASQVSVSVRKFTGSIGRTDGARDWALTAPATYDEHELSIRGDVTLLGPDRWRLRATSAQGSLFNSPETHAFTRATSEAGAIVASGNTVRGSIALTAPGELLIDMPEGWESETTLTVTPHRSGSGWDTTHHARHSMVNGDSHLHLDSDLDGTGVFELKASGMLRFHHTDIPFHGYYRSVGFVVDGVALTAPDFSMTGSLSEADGGRVGLDGGASLVGGTIGFSAPPASDPPRGSARTVPVPATPTGTSSLQLATNDTFRLPVEYSYTDQNNWSVTAAGTTSGNAYTPYTGLHIPETSFHGSITDVHGTQTWDVSIDDLTWTGMSTGVTMTSSFKLSNTCPLSAHCPSTGGIFFSSSSSIVAFASSSNISPVTATGAFLADKSWARWDAISDSLTYNGMKLYMPNLVIWKGARDDESTSLVMPDLSSYNGNGLGYEFCGNLLVNVPDVITSNTYGCLEWSNAGVVLGQVKTGGTVDAGGYNGIKLKDAQLTGYAWSNLPDTQDITLNGTPLTLTEGKNYLTANLYVFGNVMHDVGAGTSESTWIAATGWFTPAGDFSLDASIPVSLKGSGFTLDEITLHVGKDGHDFTLSMGAEATVAINGNHFPLDVYIGYEHSTDTTITVSLDTHGVPSTQPSGQMDFATLLPSGDFEPTNQNLVDGSFDTNLPDNLAQDGGFENSTSPGNLVTNPDFESTIPTQLLPNNDFEDGSTGNLLANGDGEDTDVLVNGDFELNGGTTVGWTSTSGYNPSLASDTAPAKESGSTVAVITNTGSGTLASSGLSQTVPWIPPSGTTFTVSGWVRANTSATTRFAVSVQQNACTSSVPLSTGATVSPSTTTWLQASVTVTAQPGCSGFTVVLSPTTANSAVAVDAFTFALGTTTSATSVPGVWRPHVQARFDSLASVPLASHTSNVYVASDLAGTLRSDGCQSWMLSQSSFGYTSGDFDMSVNVQFPSGGNNRRDIADIGFWMNETSATSRPSGYYFRLQTLNSDGGFGEMSANGASAYAPGHVNVPDVLRDVWYQVRLTAVSGVVTAYVVRQDTGATVFTQSLAMSGNYAHSGSFGQHQESACSSGGSRWDELSVYSTNAGALVKQDPANAHTGSGYVALKGTASSWSAEYTTGEASGQWTQYSYSAWVRAPGGNVSGNLQLQADGGSSEVASTPFTATSTWQQVSVTLRMNQAGHTDLRPGFVGMSTTGLELDVDDQVLQQLPWRAYPDGPNAITEITSTDGHNGSATALSITDHVNGSQVLYDFPANNAASGAVYTFSAWVKSAYPVSGAVRLQDSNGANVTTFTATSTWTQYTVTRAGTGGNDPYVEVDLNSGHQGQALLVDDASLTVAAIGANQAPGLGAPAAAATWTNQGNNVITQDDPSKSHGGSGHLQVGSNQATSYTAAATPAVGSTWSASAWVWTGTAGGVSTTVTLASGSDTASTTVTATGTYQQVTVNLPITQAGSTGLTMTVKNNSTAAVNVRVDDASIGLIGLSATDPWVARSTSGYVSDPVVSNAANAHTGSAYLEAKATGSGTGSLYLDATDNPTRGTTHTLTFFVRSATTGNVTISPLLATYDASGHVLDSKQESTTVGTTWTRVVLSMPIKSSGAVTMRSQIDLPAGATIRVDDVETRDLSWGSSNGAMTDAAVITRSGSAAEGANYLTITGSGNPGTVSLPVQQSVIAGASYTLTAYVRSATGAHGNLTLLFDNGSSVEQQSTAFTGTGSWQQVSVQLTATRSNSTITSTIATSDQGVATIDVDSVTLTPAKIVQDDPWTTSGSGVTFGVYDDASRAHDGSYGVLEASTTTSGSGVQHAIAQTTAPGQVYNASAWVRSSSGTPVTGTFRMATVGGAGESVSSGFTANATWQLVSLRLPIAQSGHTGFTTSLLLTTSGVTLDVDDVLVQQNPWLVTSDAGGTATQTVVTDGSRAQSGTGYLRLLNTGSAGGDAYLDTADTNGGYAPGTTWTAKVYVRSSTGAPVTGVLKVGPSNAMLTKSFTAGTSWTPVTLTYTVGGSSVLSTLRTDVRVTTAGLGLDIDTATLDNGKETADGVTTALPHPESGWTYLWDNAFGIPGAHLWDLTAQVQFINGRPGLGVAATMYHDPTKSPNVMTGKSWLKGDMALNISKAAPCFSFGFVSTGDSKISIDGGVFTASDFSMNFAPRGCQIGAYNVPKGASLSFDAGLGTADVHFDIAITEGDDGPEFTEDLAITNLVLAGTTYNNVELSIDLATTHSDVSMVADLILPMGPFHGSFDLSVHTSGLHLDGAVALTDWSLSNGDFDVSDFSFQLVMDVPFGSGSCANFSANTSGHMSMAKKTSLAFTGVLELDCGKLQVLHLAYDYHHGGLTQKFNLDYNATTHLLAGGVYFSFERSTSWKFLGHRYNRHPKIAIGLTYSMDTTKPGSTATATLGGSVSVSGGSGSLVCTISATGDDSCTINVHISPGGGHTYNDTW